MRYTGTDNNLDLFQRRVLTSIPASTMDHWITTSVIPSKPPTTDNDIGVYVPAIAKNIAI